MSYLQKNDAGSSKYMIRQHWVSDNKETLEIEAANQISRYHPAGYGTQVRDYKQLPSGEWQCYFSRGTSCD